MLSRIRLGTRGSTLARIQAARVRDAIQTHFPDLAIETKIISTQGDRDQQSSLRDLGGKGVFTKEIETALIDRRIDLAVHSLKDVTVAIAPECRLAGFLEPESVRDVLVLRPGLKMTDEKLTIGTGSQRRRVWLSEHYPSWTLLDVRGNVDTRLKKVDRGELDGVVLSEAGLIRLGLDHRISFRFDPDQFYPAPGQGVIALEARKDEPWLVSVCRLISDPDQLIISEIELSFLRVVGFDCRTPLGIRTTLVNGMIKMLLFFYSQSEQRLIQDGATCTIDQGQVTAQQLGERWKSKL